MDKLEKNCNSMANHRNKTKIILENTNTLIKIFGSSVFYNNIDYLTVKLVEWIKIVKTLRGLCENSPTYVLDNWLFHIEYESVLMWWQLTVLRIYDLKWNKVGCIHLKNDVFIEDQKEILDDDWNIIQKRIMRKKTNKNVSTNIEFTWDFWKMYSNYFDYFCNVLKIDKSKKRLVTRLDYCIDVRWISCDDVFNNYRKPFKEWSWKKWQGHYHWNTLIWWTDKSQRHEMAIYNKKLDILDKNKFKIVDNDWNMPYDKYIREDTAITRFEVRMNARSLWENWASINYCFEFCQQLAIWYIKKFYLLDLWLLFTNFEKHQYPVKDEELTLSILKQKIEFSENMFNAYANNLAWFKNEKYVFEKLWNMYWTRLQDYLNLQHPKFDFDIENLPF